MHRTLKNYLIDNTDRVERIQSSGVYQLVCSCKQFYIGRSFRSMKTRTDEHIKEISSKLKLGAGIINYRSTFAEHVISSKHNFDIHSSKIDILHTCLDNHTINLLETLEIMLAKSPDSLLNETLDFKNCIIEALINHNIF